MIYDNVISLCELTRTPSLKIFQNFIVFFKSTLNLKIKFTLLPKLSMLWSWDMQESDQRVLIDENTKFEDFSHFYCFFLIDFKFEIYFHSMAKTKHGMEF